ncbi:MAG: hypothetical protein M1826_004252 [Phylliscum demangeonii]|nr:MAG: hypothetical protein M1826_004252 [Phylliscum demangeonii]
MASAMPAAGRLPQIKCSSCHVEIDISAMGDHVCARPPPVPIPSSPPSASREESSSMPADTRHPSLRRRAPPPVHIHPLAASMERAEHHAREIRADTHPDQLMPTHVSARARSPASPSSCYEPDPVSPKSMTRHASPSYWHQKPPSPKAMNLDCAFPPFPTASNVAAKTTDDAKRITCWPSFTNPPDPPYASASQRTPSGGGLDLLQRMDAIAPGPFGIRRHPGPDRSLSPGSSVDRSKSLVSIRSGRSEPAFAMPPYGYGREPAPFQPIRPMRPEISLAAGPGPELIERPPAIVPIRPMRPEMALAAGPGPEPIRRPPVRPKTPTAEHRARTGAGPPIPQPQTQNRAVPGPLDPGPTGLRPITPANGYPALSSPAMFRHDSFDRSPASTAGRGAHAPPMKSRSNPFPPDHHAPSPPLLRRTTEPILDSVTQKSKAHPASRPPERTGSNTPPARPRRPDASAAAFPPPGVRANSLDPHAPRPRERRGPADALVRLDLSAAVNTYHSPTGSSSSNGSGYGSEARTGSSRSSPPLSGSPERLAGRSFGDALPIHSQAAPRRGLEISGVPLSSSAPLPSGLARGRPITPRGHDPAPTNEAESSTDPALNAGRRLDHPALIPRPSSPPLEPLPRIPARVPPVASRGKCRGCDQDIHGKSVSSADGRLSGRYHKHCFVCRTCQRPFDTATFYVLNDQPYCDRHYHELNDSLCQACDRGIEGQYLETERRQKYHPDCLTCQQCREILREDYFEMNGRVYCEQHAMQLSQQHDLLEPGPPGRRHPERRTTRLMVMV